jgi:CRISPR-associated protein Cmr1
MEEISVQFETITPIWTGDAWMNSSELKPSAIMGALRFWFEVFCFYSGIEVKQPEQDKLDEKLKEKNKSFSDLLVENVKNNQNKSFFQIQDEILSEQQISIPSRIFGCTGWKGLIDIKEIKPKETFKDYDYHTGKMLLDGHKGWFFPDPFNQNPDYKKEVIWGKFEVIFKVEKSIKESIFYPLLNFIQLYGFIGGKNNLGFGRVIFTSVKYKDIIVNLLNYNIFFYQGINKTEINNIVKTIPLKDLLNESLNLLDTKFIYYSIIVKDELSRKELIKKLIKKKAEERSSYRGKKEIGGKEFNIKDENRHKIFGYVSTSKNNKEEPNATKIIPIISRTDTGYSGGFISLVGLVNFPKGNN